VALNESVTARDQRAVAINERARAEENLMKARKLIDRLTRQADKLTDQPQMDDAQRATLEETLDYYRAFIENNPSDPTLRLEVIRACVRVGALQDRLGKFDLAESTLRQGVLLFQEAEASCTRTSEWRIELGRCWCGLGHILRSKQQFEEAHRAYLESIQILKPLLEVAADKTGCEILLANTYMNQAAALKALGRLDDAAISLQEAISLQKHALSNRPNNPWNRMELALALDDLSEVFAGQGRWEEAMPYCKQALQIRTAVTNAAPKVPSHREYLARSFHNLGTLQLQAKQIPEGIESLRMAVKLRSKLVEDYPSRVNYWPQFASSVQKLGLHLFRSGEIEQSIEVYENALKIAPDQAGLLNSAAWIQAARVEPSIPELAQALAFAEKATRLTPDSQAYWNTLGVVQYRREAWEDASRSFRQSVTKAGGDNCFNWLFLAMTEFQQGEGESALHWYQKAVLEMERNPTKDRELARFRIEADEIFATPPPRPQ
jgi:tetratricopeptide (TPR) repeat protein